MKTFLTIRFSYFIGFILIGALLSTALLIEFQKGMIPCPLCVVQRSFLVALGVLFLIGVLIPFKKCGQLILGLLGCLLSLGGIIFSARQVWLQHAPKDGLGDCGISLPYLFKIFSWNDALYAIWRGGIECAEQGWAFLQLSLAEWSLIWFVIFLVFVLVQMKRRV